jgi:hypothetical protein
MYVPSGRLKKFMQKTESNVLLQESGKNLEFLKCYKSEEECVEYVEMRRKYNNKSTFVIINSKGKKILRYKNTLNDGSQAVIIGEQQVQN